MYEATVGYFQRRVGDRDEILLGERNTSFANGLWNGPGGKLEKGERVISCLQRELQEESDVKINLNETTQIASVDFHYLGDSGHFLKSRVHFFIITSWSGDIYPKVGFSRFDWFPKKDLPYQIMMPDNWAWLSAAFSPMLGGMMVAADVFYGNESATVVEKVSFKLIPRPALF